MKRDAMIAGSLAVGMVLGLAASLPGGKHGSDAVGITVPIASLAVDAREVRCLALNIYHEARGESDDGKIAVGHVVMNRASDARFPRKVCDVVAQGGVRRNRCQFSWRCDGRSDKPRDRRSWQRSRDLALQIYFGQSADPTEGALWYHAEYVRPIWKHSFSKGPKIGRHIFYSRESNQPNGDFGWVMSVRAQMPSATAL